MNASLNQQQLSGESTFLSRVLKPKSSVNGKLNNVHELYRLLKTTCRWTSAQEPLGNHEWKETAKRVGICNILI